MTADEIAALMERRTAAVERELQQAVRQLGVEALAASRKFMTADIYAKPVPKRPRSGKPQWTRTGQLRRAERLQVDTSGYQVTLVNDMAYAEPRHEAGKPGRRNTRYPAHWRDQTIAALKDRPAALCEAAIERALKGI